VHYESEHKKMDFDTRGWYEKEPMKKVDRNG